MANTPPEISRDPFLDAIESLWNDGHSLIPTGKESGKVRLTKLTKKRLPLTTVLKRLESSGSKTYGITLKNIAVVDIDQKSEELVQMMLDRFGNTPFKVLTPRGTHLYYACREKPFINLRSEGHNIDIKAGKNEYVIGPNSVRPDGEIYEFIGNNFSLSHLPSITENIKVDHQVTGEGSLAAIGTRNSILIKKAREFVPYVNDLNELQENLLGHRDFHCERPETVPDQEVWKIAKWAWRLRIENKLYNGQKSVFKIDRAAYYIIYCDSKGRNAWDLYLYLVNKHGHLVGKTFALQIKGLLSSHPFHFGERGMADAINFLVKVGFLKLVRNYQVGKHGRLFQLSKPIHPSVYELG